jgi:hypothetical protein
MNMYKFTLVMSLKSNNTAGCSYSLYFQIRILTVTLRENEISNNPNTQLAVVYTSGN